MLATRRVRDLEVSAASGLVALGGRLLVVGDDELDLWVYSADGAQLLERVPLLPGALPPETALRKAEKPDLEAICLIPPAGLLVLGSGSRPNRMRGIWLPAGAGGPVEVVDLAPLYGRLATDLKELNVEGAGVVHGTLRLLQRGNGELRENAAIDLDLDAVAAALAAGRPPPAEAVRAIQRIDLGSTDEVAWSFTDASPLPDGRMVFSAAAEETDDPYEDGPIRGAALGVLDRDGRLVTVKALDVVLKVEGLHAFPDGSALLVADSDTRGAPSPLLETRWADL